MPRRKPASAKQRKAELQLKRALKRGDVPPDAGASSAAVSSSARGAYAEGGSDGTSTSTSTSTNQRTRTRTGASTTTGSDRVLATRRLQSLFVKLSPSFLEESKHRAATVPLTRPLPPERALLPFSFETSSSLIPPALFYGSSATAQIAAQAQQLKLTIMKRPKWSYGMTKKQIESNEEGMFKKWLENTDATLHGDEKAPESLPHAPPLYERNLEVWRQLWRVTEICQILLILLDSRCPPLHYPPSLHHYLSSFSFFHPESKTLKPQKKVIFVLTKVDISGAERSELWTQHIKATLPGVRVVKARSYQEKRSREKEDVNVGGGDSRRHGRRRFEPHIPTGLRCGLVDALRSAHEELCMPPASVTAASWRPSVRQSINWDAVLNAGEADISTGVCGADEVGDEDEGENGGECKEEEEFISVGLIGQPNVGKSSLLNALFGAHRVKASRTPGKTKHFQTLFWTPHIRLVDCPGLVFPAACGAGMSMELQVLAGVLPIAQVPAIASCVSYALDLIPLERVLRLDGEAGPIAAHGRIEMAAAEDDKRTWRTSGKRVDDGDDAVERKAWARRTRNTTTTTTTTMDVLSAYAVAKGWLTAKAGRPDVNRAGNAILRTLAEGRIRWAFLPPGTDPARVESVGDRGIWIEDEDDNGGKGLARDDDEGEEEEESEDESGDRTVSGDDGEEGSETAEDDELPVAGKGMFSALRIEDENSDASE